MNFGSSINAAKIFFRKNSGVILTAASVGFTIFAVVEAVRATSKAKNIIDELEYEKFEAMGMPEDESIEYHLNNKEVIKGVWKCYIPTTLLLTGALTCCICSHVSSTKKIGAMSVAYASLLETYNTYRDNVRKNIKSSEVRNIEHGVIHDIVERDKKEMSPEVKDSLFVVSDTTEVLFRDAYSSKISTGYFKMTYEDISRAEAKFNKYLMDMGSATLNDWYDFLGIGRSELGDVLEWTWADDGPLYARAIPDDIDITERSAPVSQLGLSHDEHGDIIMPSPIKNTFGGKY